MRVSDGHVFRVAVEYASTICFEGRLKIWTTRPLTAGSRIRLNRPVTGSRDSDTISKYARCEKTNTEPKGEICSATSALNVNDSDFRVDMEERCVRASAFKVISRQSTI